MPRRANGDAVARGPSVGGVERALDVLTLFATGGSPTLGVTEIAERLDLSKAVVHRALAAFRAKGFVEMDETTHRYLLGPEILFLGLSYLDRLDVRSIAREAMTGLVAATRETATLSVRVGWSRVYIDQVTPDRDVKMVVQLGRPFPLHTGASSKALLAFLPRAESERYLREHDLVRLTPLTITSQAKLRRELRGVRERGYAMSFGERDAGAGAVAAPVFGHDGQLRAVISVSGPVDRFRPVVDQAADLLLSATRGVSERLGHRRADNS